MPGREQNSYFEVANRLFRTPELSLGGQAVRLLAPPDEPPASFAGSFSWYLVETTPLNSPVIRETLFLFAERQGSDAIHDAWRIAGNGSHGKHVVCVVPDGADKFSNDRSQGIAIWNARDLFEHILRLPSDFLAHLEQVATITRPDEFTSAFQERRARVRSSGTLQSESTFGILEYFQRWLGAHRRVSPVLLLGERGLGKSWQALRLAQEAWKLHRQYPWRYGPAFVVKLRDLVNVMQESSAATPVLLEYIRSRYRGISLGSGGTAGLGALMAIGHTVVCVDGFDEMDILPTDERVRARLTELLMLLSKTTKFILTCRPGHFTSMEALLQTEAWPGATVGETFDILDLLPYDNESGWAYIDATAHDKRETIEGVLGNASSHAPLQHALNVCATHPGLLAHMKDEMMRGVVDARTLIENAITTTLIQHNVVYGRTRKDYQTANGTWVDLSRERRNEVLADIAWYIAERGLDGLDLSNLPPRIRLSYQVDDDALQRDLRSQTVLELATTAPATPDSGERCRTKPSVDMSEQPSHDAVPTSVVRFTLRDENWVHPEPGEVSVAWAYFLARHIAQRLTERGPFGAMPAEIAFRYLGRIPFGPTVGALVSDLLCRDGISCEEIGRRGSEFLQSLAKGGHYRVFSPWYKYLAGNLATMRALDASYAERINPWSDAVSSIVRPPRALPDYELAIVPPIGYADDGNPFLLGIHEVTNQQYLSFISADQKSADTTITGRQWTIERMTVAAGGSGDLSENHVLSNEYHIFFWLPPKTDPLSAPDDGGNPSASFRPPARILGQPVTYVSWFAAAAYCDWLSDYEGLSRCYAAVLNDALGRRERVPGAAVHEAQSTFRLPSREQWVWAARAGHPDVDRAWDLYPYYLPQSERRAMRDGGPDISNEESRHYYISAQRVMRAILLDPYKQSGDVIHDERNDFGVAGMVGNVREWCDSVALESGRHDSGPAQRHVLGATGYLGESTFNFEYKTPLYPRNTNPDVGFRVARTLSQQETEVLRAREAAIAALGRIVMA